MTKVMHHVPEISVVETPDENRIVFSASVAETENGASASVSIIVDQNGVHLMVYSPYKPYRYEFDVPAIEYANVI